MVLFEKLVFRWISITLLVGLILAPQVLGQCPCFKAITLSGESAYDRFGTSVACAGDVNGDDYDDLIVGSYRNDAMGKGAGRAYLFTGPNGTQVSMFTGEAGGDWFGYSVSSAGDVNGDGYDDVVVGVFWSIRAYVFLGGPGPFSSEIPSSEADLIYTGESGDYSFGMKVSGAGDVNGDGYDDLIIGAEHSSMRNEEEGRAYVFPDGMHLSRRQPDLSRRWRR